MKSSKSENIILLVLSIVAIILGILIFCGEGFDLSFGLKLSPVVPMIGKYPLVFATILFALGLFSLILSIINFKKIKK